MLPNPIAKHPNILRNCRNTTPSGIAGIYHYLLPHFPFYQKQWGPLFFVRVLPGLAVTADLVAVTATKVEEPAVDEGAVTVECDTAVPADLLDFALHASAVTARLVFAW